MDRVLDAAFHVKHDRCRDPSGRRSVAFTSGDVSRETAYLVATRRGALVVVAECST
jgi:hypothetical protein